MANDSFCLQKNQIRRFELEFSCQSVNFCFGGRYDELEARNKNKPHQHIEIYPISNIFSKFWNDVLRTSNRYRPIQELKVSPLERVHFSESDSCLYELLRHPNDHQNVKFVCPGNAQKRSQKWPQEAPNCYYTCILRSATIYFHRLCGKRIHFAPHLALF